MVVSRRTVHRKFDNHIEILSAYANDGLYAISLRTPSSDADLRDSQWNLGSNWHLSPKANFEALGYEPVQGHHSHEDAAAERRCKRG